MLNTSHMICDDLRFPLQLRSHKRTCVLMWWCLNHCLTDGRNTVKCLYGVSDRVHWTRDAADRIACRFSDQRDFMSCARHHRACHWHVLGWSRQGVDDSGGLDLYSMSQGAHCWLADFGRKTNADTVVRRLNSTATTNRSGHHGASKTTEWLCQLIWIRHCTRKRTHGLLLSELVVARHWRCKADGNCRLRHLVQVRWSDKSIWMRHGAGNDPICRLDCFDVADWIRSDISGYHLSSYERSCIR